MSRKTVFLRVEPRFPAPEIEVEVLWVITASTTWSSGSADHEPGTLPIAGCGVNGVGVSLYQPINQVCIELFSGPFSSITNSRCWAREDCCNRLVNWDHSSPTAILKAASNSDSRWKKLPKGAFKPLPQFAAGSESLKMAPTAANCWPRSGAYASFSIKRQ